MMGRAPAWLVQWLAFLAALLLLASVLFVFSLAGPVGRKRLKTLGCSDLARWLRRRAAARPRRAAGRHRVRQASRLRLLPT